ncbi:DNA topoisomerase [Infirmifilum sp. NZ]|uniref:DNA topoisomerase n=1 Tax=Infirmifilum sp. NZ TaxID=2926850 RepID=UPI0027A92387|nr:type IA DNA topoisomerase [Infirmifilum sp. NZ]UNQ72917.1 type IA DNA topoisomerase [Infirmifilum sp. NZ]
MPYDAVIVAEKPAVALAFAKFLGEGGYRKVLVEGVPAYVFQYRRENYLSIGLIGHILDFDFPKEYNKWNSIDPKQLFFVTPIQVVREGAYKYVRALRKLALQTSNVILALDADVEGEGIAFEVMKVMSQVNPSLEFKRAWFSAVTKWDILDAMNNLREPKELWAKKVFARMVVDLTVGASFTRLLTLAVQKQKSHLPLGRFLSYGPCQTPVLYLVVKRELEREQFKKKKYYVLVAELESDGGTFLASTSLGEDKEKAQAVFSSLKGLDHATVVLSEASIVEVNPPIPLATVDFESRASTFLNIRPKEALAIAEKLYQYGYISYPRTETTIYPPTLNLPQLASMFTSWEDVGWYVEKLLTKGFTPTRGRDDDKAHPPIHPTRQASKAAIVKALGEKAWRVYELVVRHFLATLSEKAQVERQKVVVKLGELELTAEGRRIVYPGFYYVYYYARPQEKPLPYLVEGDILKVRSLKLEERSTQPPPYLSESELLALMKRYGIGTDATMQDHIHTNIERRYFVVREKRCIPTPLGKTLILSLLEVEPRLVLPEVRGRMESQLAKIATGDREAEEVVAEIKETFLEYYENLASRIEAVSQKLAAVVAEVYGPEGNKKTYHKGLSRKSRNKSRAK